MGTAFGFILAIGVLVLIGSLAKSHINRENERQKKQQDDNYDRIMRKTDGE